MNTAYPVDPAERARAFAHLPMLERIAWLAVTDADRLDELAEMYEDQR